MRMISRQGSPKTINTLLIAIAISIIINLIEMNSNIKLQLIAWWERDEFQDNKSRTVAIKTSITGTVHQVMNFNWMGY